MLRIDWIKGGIPSDYDDDYLELVRLLTEGAGLEHSLMIGYLYALLSIKKKYHHLQGDITDRSFLEHSPVARGGTEVLLTKDTFLDVALEEMQHLSLVNWYLVALGAAPNFIPHTFPYTSDIYPFEIDLRSLDRYVAATYLWIEADRCKLSLAEPCQNVSEPPGFIREVRRVLKEGSRRFHETPVDEKRLNHVGSLYHDIVRQTQRVAAKPPAFLPAAFPWGEWEDRMNWILYQGEMTHYRFFRGVFTGESFGGDKHIWKPGPNYPSHEFKRQTAYTGHPNTIGNPKARRLAWLADLHYWVILCLLDTAYRSGTRKLCYKGIDNMTHGLWHLGRHLAEEYKTGLPFDPMGPQYTLGRNHQMSLHILRRLVLEASGKAAKLKDLLPERYDPKLIEITLAGLERISPVGTPGPAEEEFRFA
jgi:hypothetical protein